MQLYRDNALLKKPPVNLVLNEAEATLYIYDVIDAFWGVSAKMVIDAIAQAGDATTLNIRINSPGGDVFEARAIIEAIKRFDGKTIAHIDSLAASAATGIACAADEVLMAEGAFYMIHNASGFAWGDKTALRETADLLEKVEGAIVADYTGKTGKDAADIVAWMEAETWFSAAEAIDHGFVDGLAPTAEKVKNTWNLAAYSKAPAALLEPDPPPEPESQPQEPAPAGFFMSATNANRLRLLTSL
jgi:ATP-dependent protease ClpP protease subunit